MPSKYMQLEYKEWDKETPLVLFGSDTYFFDIDAVYDYCDDTESDISELMLVICKPNYLWTIDTDYWLDIYPEDMDLKDVASKELVQKTKRT